MAYSDKDIDKSIEMVFVKLNKVYNYINILDEKLDGINSRLTIIEKLKVIKL